MEKLENSKEINFKSIDRFFIIPRKEIYFVNFIIESYETIGFVTTIDAYKAIIKITVSPFFIKEFELLMENLKSEINIVEVTTFSSQN